jgi:hypothetical protein
VIKRFQIQRILVGEAKYAAQEAYAEKDDEHRHEGGDDGFHQKDLLF